MLGWGGGGGGGLKARARARAAARCCDEAAAGRKRKKMCWRVVLALWQLEGGVLFFWGGVLFVCFGMDIYSYVCTGGSTE